MVVFINFDGKKEEHIDLLNLLILNGVLEIMLYKLFLKKW